MKPTIICSSSQWDYVDGGVHSYMQLLISGLQKRGYNARGLVTEPYRKTIIPPEEDASIPIDTLPVRKDESWNSQWKKMQQYLETHAPCIYLSNKDFRHSCIASVLPTNIKTVGVLHSDDPTFYEHAQKNHMYWDGSICVSNTIFDTVTTMVPSMKSTSVVIPYGIHIKQYNRTYSPSTKPLKLLYVGRLQQAQKRIMDLAHLAHALSSVSIPFHFSLAGFGPDEALLKAELQTYIDDGSVEWLGAIPNSKVQQLCAQHDIVLLVSDFEGLPIALLEAMSQGCVPIVSDIKSGIPNLILHGKNGMRFPIGDMNACVECIQRVHTQRSLLQTLGEAARQTITDHHSIEQMLEKHELFFQKLTKKVATRSILLSVDPPEDLQPLYKRLLSGYFVRKVQKVLQMYYQAKETLQKYV